MLLTVGMYACYELKVEINFPFFLLTTASRTALGPIQPPIQWISWVLSLGKKRPGRKADQSPPSNAEVKNDLHSSNTPTWRDAQLKHRDNFVLKYLIMEE
jgi:hypothetical protein